MRSLLLTLAMLLVSFSVRAQDSAAPGGGAVVTIRQADEKRFPEISLVFEVKSAIGEPILDATQSEFQVKEEGRPVSITKFQSPLSREFRATSVVLVLDRSGSMNLENRLDGLKRAVSAFVDKLPKGSRVAVIAFGSEVELICPFTDDPQKVLVAADSLFANGATRYYDAVAEAIALLSEETGRRAILAMTDGDDKGSRMANLESVIALAVRSGLPIHTLALGSEEEIASENLRILAEKTRGQAFKAINPAALRGIFEEIARSMAQTYSLSYTTDHKIQDGTLRPIEVLYAKSSSAAKSAVYVPGMIVPAAGWSWLFLATLAAFAGLSRLPSLSRR